MMAKAKAAAKAAPTGTVMVKAARAHRTGYAVRGKVAKDGTYHLPADRVASHLRQGLIEDPNATTKG